MEVSYIYSSIIVLPLFSGVIPASINAATLALIDAGIPLTDFVASCAVGVIGEALVGQSTNLWFVSLSNSLDLNEAESNAVGAELTIAIHRRSGEVSFFWDLSNWRSVLNNIRRWINCLFPDHVLWIGLENTDRFIRQNGNCRKRSMSRNCNYNAECRYW